MFAFEIEIRGEIQDWYLRENVFEQLMQNKCVCAHERDGMRKLARKGE